ncbi:hypothetical protein ENUP19_0219G0027 [Entamoeba nuttalli]|uniref:Uncharacterized protein n=2 Tax=Entamoeba nuttalli TaxID=412467 RepID=K2H8S8_ENTNP|nr:hypothetical protein ENU1_146640 [Entamoeba nuttalli P19]EKE38954.1 hypothetical protein ENU1_146640 [Entamoeba nuttalli P19]|eukprot:XP_008858712.1 hypothetical protein ENU1_146640 [Entamoeba nuttalli P19]
MSKEVVNRGESQANQYFPSYGSAYSYYQHQNKILLQKREDLKHELLITQKLWSAFPNADEYIATKRPLEIKTETKPSTQQTSISSVNCKPPEIRLSTAKVFRYRPFSLILTMSSTWRENKGLTYEQVFQAVAALKCKKEGEEEEFATCAQCSGKQIIEIGSSSGTSYQPTVSDDKTEMYIFDHCKTNCSSSRDHHKKKLQIVITLADEKIITVPFSIQAREKKSSKVKSNTIQPHKAISSNSPLSNSINQFNIMGQSDFPNQQSQQTTFQTYQGTFNQILPQTNNDSTERVALFVFSTCLQPPQIIELINDYKNYLSRIEGFVNLRVSFLEGLFFVFAYFMDVAHAEECISITKLYLNNDIRYPNIYKKKLSDDNIAIILSVFYNWSESGQLPTSFFSQPF